MIVQIRSIRARTKVIFFSKSMKKGWCLSVISVSVSNDVLFVNRPPGSHLLCQQTMTPQTFCPGGCIMFCLSARVAGCPRRLPNKKLTKSYTRYPVGGASGPVRRSLWPGPAVPGRSMAVVHPILDYIARSACSTLPLRSMVAVVLPLFRGLGW